MDFLTLAKQRYSVRAFDGKSVEWEKIEKILKAGKTAPTACNFQPQKVYVITGNTLEKVKRCTKYHFNAPLVFLICYDEKRCWERSYDKKKSGDIDASIVATHMMMEAFELGIGSTWVMMFDPQAVKKEFNLPDQMVPTCFLPMGYPAENAEPSALHEQYRAEDEIFVILK